MALPEYLSVNGRNDMFLKVNNKLLLEHFCSNGFELIAEHSSTEYYYYILWDKTRSILCSLELYRTVETADNWTFNDCNLLFELNSTNPKKTHKALCAFGGSSHMYKDKISFSANKSIRWDINRGFYSLPEIYDHLYQHASFKLDWKSNEHIMSIGLGALKNRNVKIKEIIATLPQELQLFFSNQID